ncbi:MAG TPA: hypothetical protein VLF61_04540 [Rhabdochlamydiaceae bacterium]|nr:hypothetical protein [Rhabdochlamydiaceae bacterium]
MISSLLHLVYPALCLHCKALLFSHKKLLCSDCLEMLTLIDPKTRCIKCFKESGLKVCGQCRKRPSKYKQLAACFEHFGPAISLAHAFKNRIYLDQVLASWMVVQMEQAGFPLPQLILSFPCTVVDKILEGYHRARLLADKIGEFYQVPVRDLLLKSQEGEFSLKKQVDFSGQTILLVVEEVSALEPIVQCVRLLNDSMIYIIACNYVEIDCYNRK